MNTAAHLSEKPSTSARAAAATRRTASAARRQQDVAAVIRRADRIIDKSQAAKAVAETARSSEPLLSRQQRRRDRLKRLELPSARDLETPTIERSVEDPYKPGSRQTVTINRRVDVLQDELAHRNITPAAFAVGREIQNTLETMLRGGSSSNWNAGTRGDPADANVVRIARGVTNAREIQAEMSKLAREVGEIGARFLREILAEGVTFAQYAEKRGRGGERATTDVAKRFRWLLEQISDARAARGKA